MVLNSLSGLFIRVFSGQLFVCDIPELRSRRVNKVGIVGVVGNVF